MDYTRLRIGSGFDVHAFSENRDLILGGVKIPHKLGLLGHSDADVLIHSIIDALLGAANLGDIGSNFPDNDKSYKDISSTILLQKIQSKLHSMSWIIINIDATIICQAPKLALYLQKMKEKISSILVISIDTISIKATTTEKLGFTGREEGIAAQCSCLIYKKSD
jgi:2-C-methyl-D-erythritol 2,4-cyclodiphosphate synthase